MTLLRADIVQAAAINGKLYSIRTKRTLSNGEVADFTITAPTSPPETISLAVDVDPVGEVGVEVYRGTTLNATPGGTVVPLINNNESSSNTAATVVLENPAIDAVGELIVERSLGASRKNQRSLGAGSGPDYLGDQQETTLVRLSSGIASNTMNVSFTIIE